jgi:hypothetical protein
MVIVLVDVEMCRYDEQNGVAVLTAATDLTTFLMILQMRGLIASLGAANAVAASKALLMT